MLSRHPLLLLFLPSNRNGWTGWLQWGVVISTQKAANLETYLGLGYIYMYRTATSIFFISCDRIKIPTGNLGAAYICRSTAGYLF